MSETLLRVENLEVYYGVIRALKGISFEVKKGEIVSLIGANGAGKTTTLHTVTGLIRPKNGSVFYKGEDITKYIWTVTKDGSPIVNQEEYTSWDTPDVDFETLGAGEYAYTLVVENSAGLTSDTYTRFLQVTEDTIKPAVSLSPANAGWTTTQHKVELIINDEDS